MHKADPVIYIDPFGGEHVALVFAAKRRNAYKDRDGNEHVDFIAVDSGSEDCVVSGAYIDEKAPESEAIKKFFDVPHMTDESRQEPNPALPTYHVNCWKEVGEAHEALPADHPAFDHPHLLRIEDESTGVVQPHVPQDGKMVPVTRPDYHDELDAHLAKPETQQAIAEAKAKERFSAEDIADAIEFVKSRKYSQEAAEAIVHTSDLVHEMAEHERARRRAAIEAQAAPQQGKAEDPGSAGTAIPGSGTPSASEDVSKLLDQEQPPAEEGEAE